MEKYSNALSLCNETGACSQVEVQSKLKHKMPCFVSPYAVKEDRVQHWKRKREDQNMLCLHRFLST